MLIAEDELERMHKRFPYPRFSSAEYERRYSNIRAMMKDKNLDCLLIIGGSAAYGRLWFNVRYVTNMMGKAEMANYCFFPKDGAPCLVVRPGHSLASGMLARSAVREVIVGDPNVLAGIVNTIQERGYDKVESESSNTIRLPRSPKITGSSSLPGCRKLNSFS